MELDLHGYKHADVIDKLNHFFFWEYPNCDEYTIITGNSNRMKKIVKETCIDYNFNVSEHPTNYGCLIVRIN